jgi:hypothetical protein
MTHRPTLVLLLASLLLAGQAEARYARPDLKQVPVARLIENLEAKLKERPDDPKLLHSLARVHAMAYARQLEDASEVEVRNGREEEGVWSGYVPPHLPFGKAAAGDEERGERASQHLQRALALYDQAETKAPDDLVIRLGRAWCMAQAGDEEGARSKLRTVLAAAWEQESERRSGGGRPFLTVETSEYLLPLLDAEADAEEIAQIEERVAHLKALPRKVTPLAVPLVDGAAPSDLIDAAAAVPFDLDGSGRPLRWQWITPQAAWLVIDHEGRGAITSALQLFGNRTFNLFHADGYQALALLDEDGDGWLRGRELRELALWRDVDGDGVSDAGEVQPLEAWGIAGLGCRSELHASGIPYAPEGVEWADGRRRPSFDLVLERR